LLNVTPGGCIRGETRKNEGTGSSDKRGRGPTRRDERRRRGGGVRVTHSNGRSNALVFGRRGRFTWEGGADSGSTRSHEMEKLRGGLAGGGAIWGQSGEDSIEQQQTRKKVLIQKGKGGEGRSNRVRR